MHVRPFFEPGGMNQLNRIVRFVLLRLPFDAAGRSPPYLEVPREPLDIFLPRHPLRIPLTDHYHIDVHHAAGDRCGLYAYR